MTEPQRVLHFVVPGSPEQRTGGYLYGARVVEGLRREGWEVRVHGLDGSFPGGDEVAHGALAELLEGLPGDAKVVVDGLAMGGVPGPVVRAGGRLRILGLVHHPLADETGLSARERERLRASEPQALAACRGVVVTSDFTAERVRELGVPPERVRTVLPGTRPAETARGPGPGTPLRLLTVGAVIPRKGQDVLVRALDRVRGREWEWVCVGSLQRDRSYAEKVLEEIRALGLQERVRFAGELRAEALEEEYRKATLFVLPSHYEGYGMALTEAMTRGLPVLSTTGGAIPYTVPSAAGILVPPGDEAALADALERLLGAGGAELRARFSRNARAHAATLPDWAVTARSFAGAVRELLGEGGGGAVETGGG